MKKLYILMAMALAVPALLSSCKKVLQKDDPQNLSRDAVFNDSTLTKFNLDYIYAQNQPQWFGTGSVSYIKDLGPLNLTEECYSDNAMVKGTLTIESVGDIGTSNSNATNYGKLRYINNFIESVNGGTQPAGTKTRFVGQALFWRAFRYFELVKMYGGVPLVTSALDAVGDDALSKTYLPRATTSDVFKQIVADLNTAAASLPVKWPNSLDQGRITKGIAQAMLSRVLLTYASPQFNSPLASMPATATSVVATTDQTRWQAAYDATNAAIATLSANGFGLFPKWDYTMWTTENNSEAVFVTEYNTDQTDNGRNSNGYVGGAVPKAVATSGGAYQPTWDMVNAFPMADGKAPGTSTKYPYNTTTPPINFYANRDPRFYQTIAYNGCSWPLVGNTANRLWTYFYFSNTAGTASKTTEAVAASTTGFYLRKAIDPTISAANLPYAGTDWQEIRYAELVLNHAEAAAELGKLTESYADLVAIRKRAGIEAGSDNLYGLTAGMDHDAMINAIMYERQIEFAYEGKRYWDLRRRKLLEVTLNGKRRSAVTIMLKNTGTSTDYILATRDATPTSGTAFDTFYTTNFTITTKQLDTYNIAYQTADYFFGIPTNAIKNNPSLVQTSTWGGTFNPLQ
ncbi:RagB/SusD family nutrient uptake outer membrane protein [Mucilaginibacter mali]|uniref:RagB/SusD family nutrient uptake outer membrane protein n=1 Tax=Mucilaginibacter mali TaxID=2740462 RepID=A0A7D4UE33_9SPHI|nr:RagB/SusD family nutrient uptake outer membrane protein [Mucilaginibacter mali]QKJ28516.1 RagB/SusD family nutrient uptake outer membrane protein [Mucilaginibacter mali]